MFFNFVCCVVFFSFLILFINFSFDIIVCIAIIVIVEFMLKMLVYKYNCYC